VSLLAGEKMLWSYHFAAGDAARLQKEYESFVVTAFMRSR